MPGMLSFWAIHRDAVVPGPCVFGINRVIDAIDDGLRLTSYPYRTYYDPTSR